MSQRSRYRRTRGRTRMSPLWIAGAISILALIVGAMTIAMAAPTAPWNDTPRSRMVEALREIPTTCPTDYSTLPGAGETETPWD